MRHAVRGAFARCRPGFPLDRWRQLVGRAADGTGPRAHAPVAGVVRMVVSDEAVRVWWADLPSAERTEVLRLGAGAAVPEEVVVGLLMAGARSPVRPSVAHRVGQPAALRRLIDQELAWRAASASDSSTRAGSTGRPSR